MSQQVNQMCPPEEVLLQTDEIFCKYYFVKHLLLYIYLDKKKDFGKEKFKIFNIQ